MSSTNPTWSPCQEKALNLLQTSADNIFLTGRAGTGKSYLIRYFLKDRDPKTFPVVASTGAAAIGVNGRTFHSFFGLGIMEGGIEKTIERALKDRRVVKRLQKIGGFILDEVSMIPGPALNAAETICRLARKKHLPWGGARVIAVGDFAQLPPVSRGNQHQRGATSWKKEWAFLDATWSKTQFTSVVLETIMRSIDAEYLSVLNHVRNGVVNEEVELYLNRRTNPDAQAFEATYLFPHRETSENFNLECLAKLKTPLQKFSTLYSGDTRFVEQLKKNAPIPEVLQIKESALVMTRMNDPQMQYINGSLGTVMKINDEEITIQLKNGRTVEIKAATFSQLDANGEPVATATNFPITLAYASTIHKAQGATLDAMVCDLRRLWEPGQAYVALSRLKKGSDLTLTGWDAASIRTDPDVMAFHQSLMK